MTDLRRTKVNAQTGALAEHVGEGAEVCQVSAPARQHGVRLRALWVGLVLLALAGHGIEHSQAGAIRVEQTGEASWYGPGFHGKQTASGEVFDQNEMTAAHRSLPLGTKAEVTSVETGKSVEVTINDRGPYVKGRVIDLSKAAAKELGMTKEGTTTVRIEAEPAKKGEGKEK